MAVIGCHHVFELWLNILRGTEQCPQSKETELVEWALCARNTNEIPLLRNWPKCSTLLIL